MKSLREIVDSSPQLRGVETKAALGVQGSDESQPLAKSAWNWQDINKVLVIRLRSIGDTVLATPSLTALKRFVPNAQVDILVEDWVAPVLDEHPSVDNVVSFQKGNLAARARIAPLESRRGTKAPERNGVHV